MKLGRLTPVDDRKIIERVLNGDTEAFNLLVRQWEKPIYNFILRMIGDRDEAMDLCQDSFMKAYRELSTLKFSSGSEVRGLMHFKRQFKPFPLSAKDAN